MHDPPQVSVVIPVFNGENVIGRALASVRAQTFSDLEIIVVDDGSTDRTVDRLGERAGAPVNLIKHARNRGAAAARNTGIGAARGRWIAFLDCDDTWAPDKLSRQLEWLEKSGAAACASGYRLHKNGRELVFNLKLTPRQFRREILFGCTISPGSTLVVGRQPFKELGAFDESLLRLEDWDWLLRFAARYDMAFVPEPLADIHAPAQPRREDFAKVADALDHIGRKHLPRLAPLAKTRLRGSILIEKAALFYRAGRPLSAAGYVAAALSVYPFRNAAFFRMIWRSVRNMLRL